MSVTLHEVRGLESSRSRENAPATPKRAKKRVAVKGFTGMLLMFSRRRGKPKASEVCDEVSARRQVYRALSWSQPAHVFFHRPALSLALPVSPCYPFSDSPGTLLSIVVTLQSWNNSGFMSLPPAINRVTGRPLTDQISLTSKALLVGQSARPSEIHSSSRLACKLVRLDGFFHA